MSIKTVTTIQYVGQEEHEGFEFTFKPLIETLTIEKVKRRVGKAQLPGYVARYLIQDTDPTAPDDDDDEALFLVGYHRDFTVDRGKRIDGRWVPGLSQELAQCIAQGGKEEDGSFSFEAQKYIKTYHIFGLEAYIHSGVTLALSKEGNFPDRGWDVSQLGLVFVSKAEWKTRAKARQAALGLIKSWNAYLSDDVYTLVREDYDKDKKQINFDTCGGYSGYNYALEALKKEI